MPSENLPDSEEQIAFAVGKTVEILTKRDKLVRVVLNTVASNRVASGGTYGTGDGLFTYDGVSIVFFSTGHCVTVVATNGKPQASKTVSYVTDVPGAVLELLDSVVAAAKKEEKKLVAGGSTVNYVLLRNISNAATSTFNATYTNSFVGTWNAF